MKKYINKQIYKYKTVLFLFLNLFDACDKYQSFSLCTYFYNIPELLLSYSFNSGSKWSNIFYRYDGNCVLKNCLISVPLKDKKSATIPKHLKDFKIKNINNLL